jgi:hypothetical protein
MQRARAIVKMKRRLTGTIESVIDVFSSLSSTLLDSIVVFEADGARSHTDARNHFRLPKTRGSLERI